jgi:hypothetical protein
VCFQPYVSSMQCATTILSSKECPALQYFSTLSHKQQDFREKIIEHKLCVLIFCTNFPWNSSHSKKNDENVNWSSCKVHVILVLFSWNLNFLNRLSKSTQISNFLKICPVEEELFHADRHPTRTPPGYVASPETSSTRSVCNNQSTFFSIHCSRFTVPQPCYGEDDLLLK